MPSLIGSLFVSLTADFAPFQRNMQSAEAITASTTSSIRRNMGLTEKSVSGLQRSMSSGVRPYALISAARTFDTAAARANLLRGSLLAVTAAFGGLGAALTTNVVTRYFDSFKGIENRIRDVSSGSADLAANIEGVSDAANRSRASLQAVATLYTRLQRSSPGEAPTKILRRVETINKALQLGGATAQEAASAAIQFSQAIQSNRLGGDELRAVLETPLGTELAKGMGITIGQLRALSKQGKLTSDVLYKALDRISGEVDTRFAKSFATIDQALTVADNKIIAYAGSLDKAYGITSLITGAIGKFGDNLDTIVPLLGLVGNGLGLLFAARGGASLGSFLSKPLKGFQAMKAARLEDIRLATAEVAVAKEFANQQQIALAAARKATTGDVSGLVPKSLLKEYERNLAAVQKADADHLNLLEQKGRVTTQLGEIYRTTTVKELKAAQALADQEEKVNQARAHRGAVGQLRNIADKQLFTAFGGGDADQIARTKKAIAEIEREEIAAAGRVAREETKLETTRATLVKQNGAAFTAAAEQRATILVGEKKLVDDIAKSEERRASLVQKLSTTRQTIQTQGGDVAAGALKEAERNALGAANAYERASSSLSIMRRGASAASLAIGALGLASRSLFAFLGGPWGVAIIAGASLLEYFGARAAAAAQEERKFQDILAQRVGKVAQGSGADSLEAQLQVAVARQKELNDELKTTQDGYARVISIIGNVADAIPSQANASLQQFKADFELFKAGNLSLDEFRKRVNALTELTPEFRDGFNNALDTISDTVKDTSISINSITEDIKAGLVAIDRLRSKVAGIYDDEGRSEFVKNRRQNLAHQYDQYGAGQEALRRRVEQERKRQELLAAAGDTGDQARNTPAKIAARAQELLEQGYVDTREEANALAAEELNLAEKTRLANKAAQSGTKDFENFAHKIAELREQASGAFLSDLDQKVLNVAKSLKDGSALMKQYVDAINSGDLSKAPKELLEAREALMEIGAADTWRGILQQFGRGAQLTQTFAEKQAELMYLLANGRITADQATAAYSNFIASFEQYGWIDSTSKAISQFAGDAISDFKNVGDAFKNLAKRLLQIATEELVTKPLEQNVRNFLASLVGGGNQAGPAPSGFNLLGALFGRGTGGAPAAQAASPASTLSTVASSIAAPIGKVVRSALPAIVGTTKGGIPLAQISAQGLTARVNAAYADRFQGLLNDLTAQGYKITSLGEGGYSYRNVAGSKNLSNHAYGNALDINPRANPWTYARDANGNPITNLPSNINELAQKNGLFWGGNWNKADTMHFQVDKANKALDRFANTANSATVPLDKITNLASSLIGSNGFDYSKLLPQNGFKADPGGFAAMLGIPAGGLGGAGNGGFLNSLFGGIADLLGSLFKGGGSLLKSILGGIGSLFGLIFHGGGKVGSTSAGRMLPASAFANAPRLHSGLKSDEFASILQRGERVLTARDERKTMDTISGLSRRVAASRGKSAMKVEQHFHLDGAITKDDVVEMVGSGINQAVDTSKRSFPDWQIEYGRAGAFS